MRKVVVREHTRRARKVTAHERHIGRFVVLSVADGVLFRLGCRYKNDPLVLLPITPGCAGSFSSLCACTDYDTAVEWVEQWNGLNDNPDKAKFIKVLVEIEFAPKQAAAVANWTRQVPRP